MTPDVLFWFYKDFNLCRDRLHQFRKQNRDVRVFALYGGPLEKSEEAKITLGDQVDDFYLFSHQKTNLWKWYRGDRMLLTWYEERGRHLEWETLFIMQWDMLILDSLDRLFKGLEPGELLLSGYRPFKEVSEWWHWGDPDYSELDQFRKKLRNEFKYDGDLFACLFVVSCLPRIFFEKSLTERYPEPGFLEYKIPTMAKIYNIPVCCDHDFEPWWNSDPAVADAPVENRTLNAIGYDVPIWVILKELADTGGSRLFHPYSRHFPDWIRNKLLAFLLFQLLKTWSSISNIIRKRLQQLAWRYI